LPRGAYGTVCRVSCSGLECSGARFATYLTTVLRISYDNAEVTVDLRRSSIIYKTSCGERKAFLGYESLRKS